MSDSTQSHVENEKPLNFKRRKSKGFQNLTEKEPASKSPALPPPRSYRLQHARAWAFLWVHEQRLRLYERATPLESRLHPPIARRSFGSPAALLDSTPLVFMCCHSSSLHTVLSAPLTHDGIQASGDGAWLIFLQRVNPIHVQPDQVINNRTSHHWLLPNTPVYTRHVHTFQILNSTVHLAFSRGPPRQRHKTQMQRMDQHTFAQDTASVHRVHQTHLRYALRSHDVIRP